MSKKKYRTVWISDVHLGTPASCADDLCDFLKEHSCENMYLIGDIIDGWRLKADFYWPQEHTNVVRRILTAAKRGTKVTYITGNHDEFLRKFVDYRLEIGNIKLANEAIHTTADGKQLLVIHGDLFDVVTRYHRWLAFMGDHAYRGLIRVNRLYNRYRRMRGKPYWSLSAFAKHQVKTAVNFISEFEDGVAYECRSRDLDGVVCGHIHHAEIREIDGVTYFNSGDWVESCTALVEDFEGDIRIVNWHDENKQEESPTVVPIRAQA